MKNTGMNIRTALKGRLGICFNQRTLLSTRKASITTYERSPSRRSGCAAPARQLLLQYFSINANTNPGKRKPSLVEVKKKSGKLRWMFADFFGGGFFVFCICALSFFILLYFIFPTQSPLAFQQTALKLDAAPRSYWHAGR